MENIRAINRQVFQFMQGRWSAHRQFEGNYRGAFQGDASFVLESGGAPAYRYTEQGKLTDEAGQRFDAKQSYRYCLTEKNLEVLKREDAVWTVMHQLDFRDDGGIATAGHTHLCGQDHYTAVYRVDLSGSWEVSYRVTGPKKDYRICTKYSRLARE